MISLQRVSAIVIVVGAIVFLSAAALPVSMRVFPEPSPIRRLGYIEAAPTAWIVAQVLFAVGAALTVVGIGLLARGLADGFSTALMRVSVVVLFVALLPWVWHLYARAVDPAMFAAGSFPRWPLMTYFLLTELGLVIFGVSLLRTPLPSWVGWVVIGSMTLVFVLTLITRDMVPAVYYLVTLLTGVMLYR